MVSIVTSTHVLVLAVGLCLDTWLFVIIQVIGVEEDVSVYDIADHPDFHFRTTDIVIRIWNSENGQNDCENEVRTTTKNSYLSVSTLTEHYNLRKV